MSPRVHLAALSFLAGTLPAHASMPDRAFLEGLAKSDSVRVCILRDAPSARNAPNRFRSRARARTPRRWIRRSGWGVARHVRAAPRRSAVVERIAVGARP